MRLIKLGAEAIPKLIANLSNNALTVLILDGELVSFGPYYL